MKKVEIQTKDVIDRIYFITKLVQNQNTDTMQGVLTSKSDSMGGIFDRFINTISDSVVFDRFFLPDIKNQTQKEVELINDYYFYKPSNKNAGIAPDIFGIKVEGKTIPFTIFDNKWKAVDGMPQIEIKTFKEKDQMVSLRNQNYDDKYLILLDLKLRKDYLVPFFDKNILNNSLVKRLTMDDKAFIIKDENDKISKISQIDFNNDKIGDVSLLAVTKGRSFMKIATLCKPGGTVYRMKEIKKLKRPKQKVRCKLKNYVKISEKNNNLYAFNNSWKKKMNTNSKTLWLEFSTDNINGITIVCFNEKSVTITSDLDCCFNEEKIEKDEFYSVVYEKLEKGNGKEEYFMQKQCVKYMDDYKDELIGKIVKIVNDN